MKKVLIVDDETYILSALKRVLRHENIEVLSAESGQQALGLMQKNEISLVLSDYKMPEMTGTELLKQVAEHWPHTQRMIISGHADFETVLASIHSGVVHKFLAKPWSNQELLQHVRGALVLVDPGSEDYRKPESDGTTDISQQKKSYRVKPLQTQVHLQAILNTVRDGIVTYRSSGEILSVNQSLMNCFGYSDVELLEMRLEQIIPDFVNGYLVQGIHQLVGLKKNGEVFPLELNSQDMSEQGVEQQLAVIRDLTQWAKTEAENKQLLTALEHGQDGFALFNAAGELIRCNNKFRLLYQECQMGPVVGVKYEKFLADCLDSGLFPAVGNDRESWIKKVVAANVDTADEYYQLNNEQWIQIHQTRVENDCFISFHLDITQTKQAQTSLQQAVLAAQRANSARGRFLAMMSHEIRTPLNGVLGLLQLMRDTALDDEQLKYVDTAEASGQGLLSIITDILDFSKIEAEKLVISKAECELPKLIESIKHLFSFQLDEKDLFLNLEIGKSVAKIVWTDEHRLRQILINLVGNAIKFTAKGGIFLKVERRDQQYTFSVRDTGVGIAKIDQEKIFQEFCTVENHSKNVGEGTGLGLVISQKLVRLLGGTLHFTSEHHKGSLFWFELDLPEVKQSSVPSVPKETLFASLTGQVLLVDDSKVNRLVAGKMLRDCGLNTIEAENGEEAVALCKVNQFDLILMDISMPIMDGLAATKIIQSMPSYRDVPIIALTAYVMTEDKERFFVAGMIDTIEKPIQKKALIDVVAVHLNTVPEHLITAVDTPLDLLVQVESGQMSDRQLKSAPDPIKPKNLYLAQVLFDPMVLQQLVSDTGPEVLPDLCDVFIADITERVTDIKGLMALEQLEGESLILLKRHFHTLGSSSAIYGLLQLQSISRQLEADLSDITDIEIETIKESLFQFLEVVKLSVEELAAQVKLIN